MSGEIVIFKDHDGTAQIEVRLESDTLWLTQYQLEEVFDTDRSTIVKHIKNILSTGELEESSTCAKFAQVRKEGGRQVNREIVHYNLDMIISIGYRVNSKRGTQFRIWANRVLKEHLLKGYTINRKLLEKKQENIDLLMTSIQIIERSLQENTPDLKETREIMRVLSVFSGGLSILDDYDHGKLEETGQTQRSACIISTEEFVQVIERMRKDYDSDIFARQKDQSFESSVRQIYQSFNKLELYPSIEHKAAMLLYFVVKNHSFVDGNKRIAATLFLYFLNKNELLYKPDGKPRISNEGLAALTLLIAVSKPEEKDTMVNIIITILNRN